MKKKFSVFLIGIIASANILAGCGGSEASKAVTAEAAYSYDDSFYSEELSDGASYDYEADVYEYSVNAAAKSAGAASQADGAAETSEVTAQSGRKLIRTVNMSVETREFDQLLDTVNTKVENLGGYVESSNINGNSYGSSSKRDAFIVARIPSKSLDNFVTLIEEKSNITNKNESAEDVTLQYSDVESRISSLRIEQERLNALLDEAENLESIIELENRLTDVRYELESYESRLRTMDNQVDYSTVNLNIYEVIEYTPEPVRELSFGERLSAEFLEGCESAWETIQEFIIGFIAFLPELIVILVILAIIFFIIFFIVKGIISLVKKLKIKKSKKAAAKPVVAVALDVPKPSEDNVNLKESAKKPSEDNVKP